MPTSLAIVLYLMLGLDLYFKCVHCCTLTHSAPYEGCSDILTPAGLQEPFATICQRQTSMYTTGWQFS